MQSAEFQNLLLLDGLWLTSSHSPSEELQVLGLSRISGGMPGYRVLFLAVTLALMAIRLYCVHIKYCNL